MTIRQLILGLAISILTLAAMATLSLVLITSRMNRTTVDIGNAIESIRATEELQIGLLNHDREALLEGLSQGSLANTNRQAQKEEVAHWLNIVRRLSASSEENALIKETETRIRRYFQVRQDLQKNRSTRGSVNLKATQSLDDAYQAAERLTSLNLAQARAFQAHVAVDSEVATLLGLIIGILCGIFIPVSWFLVRQWIYAPIRNLDNAISTFSISLPGARAPEEGVKELKQIGSSFNQLVDRLVSQRESRLRFLASVAHDLRNPLGAIRMSADLLTNKDFSKEERRPVVDIISKQVVYLDRMVGDLLDASRIESGQLELKKKPLNIVSLVQDSITLHRSLSSLHEIVVRSEADEIICDCDPLRISQVMNNLLSNAIKYSPNGGLITVQMSRETGKAVIRVQDEGIGIPVEEQAHIFEPFRRTKLTRLSIPGVGLGLSVTRRILLAHGGSIEFESQPQHGTTFTVRLPLSGATLRAPKHDIGSELSR